MAKYALSQRSGETYDAAGKAMRDVYKLLNDEGFRTVWSMPKKCNKYLKILDIIWLSLFSLFRLGAKDCIFYCIPENKTKIKLVNKLKKIKKFRTICFINDLNTFRYGESGGAEVVRNLS